MKNENLIFPILIFILFLSVSCCPTNLRTRDQLTELYGQELREAYENYKKAVVDSYETGDTSRLPEVAVGIELKNLTKFVGTQDAKTAAEVWKVEVLSIKVKEYSVERAEAILEEQVIGDSPEYGQKHVWIVRFQQDEKKWKISDFESYFSSNN